MSNAVNILLTCFEENGITRGEEGAFIAPRRSEYKR